MRARTNGSAAPLSCQHTPRDAASETPVTPRDLSDYLEAARVRLGIQVKAIAFWWDCDHGYVSRVLAGKEKLTDERFAQLRSAGDEDALRLYRATIDEMAADVDMLTGRRAALLRTLEGITALALDDRLDVPVRMAKADLR